MLKKIQKIKSIKKTFSRVYSNEVKNFEFVNLSSNISIRSNGSLDIEEDYKFLFRGNFSYGMRYFPLGEAGKLDRIRDIKVKEAFIDYKNKEDSSAYTFKTVKKNNFTIIHWYNMINHSFPFQNFIFFFQIKKVFSCHQS